MRRSEKYILFLNNRYSGRENEFYLRLLRGKTRVAVDGGIRFFRKNNIYPDIFIGDFDSAPRLSAEYLSHFEVIAYPSAKAKTDGQLAVETALERGARRIVMCGAVGQAEIDHTLGNIFLLELVNRHNRRRKVSVDSEIISPTERVRLVDNGRMDIAGRRGDFVSIIPLTGRVTVDFDGFVYPVPKRSLHLGETYSLRNRLARSKGWVEIAGRAIVVHISGPGA